MEREIKGFPERKHMDSMLSVVEKAQQEPHCP